MSGMEIQKFNLLDILALIRHDKQHANSDLKSKLTKTTIAYANLIGGKNTTPLNKGEQVTTLICDVCNATSITTISSARHRLKHTMKNDRKQRAKRNLPSVNGKISERLGKKCAFCKRLFISLGHLDEHMNVKHGRRIALTSKQKQFPCERCGIHLSTLHYLKLHQSNEAYCPASRQPEKVLVEKIQTE